MLPFTVEQFLGVFARYNQAIWPLQVGAYLLGIAALALVWRRTSTADRFVAAVLGLFWVVNGALYHITYFREINPIAVAFGALFLVQAALFLWVGVVRGGLTFAPESTLNAIVGGLMVAYAMVVYPLLGLVFGHVYPASPVFGVAPCPTVIFTLGLLVWAGVRLPRWMLIVPLAWAALGLSAAVQLGIHEDLGLLVAGLVAAVMLLPTHHATGEERLRPGHAA
jgi:uncharacterized protein DUF6064